MKFHNQRDFMGHKISNVTNKPLLHKKGKQWIVVAVSALILAGFGGVVSTTTHADTTNNGVKTESATSNSANNKPASASSTQQQANAMHHNLLLNASVQKPSNLTTTNNNGNNSNNSSSKKPAVHMLGLGNPAPTSHTSDPIAPKNASYVSSGTWGHAHWTSYNIGTIHNKNASDGKTALQLDIYGGEPMGNWPSGLPKNQVVNVYTKDLSDSNPGSNIFGQYGQGSNLAYMPNVQHINLNGFPPNWTGSNNLGHAFCSDPNLQTIDLGQPDTSGVNWFDTMFTNDYNLQSINGLQYFDTSSVNDMSNMFYHCYKLESLDLSSFDTHSNKKGQWNFVTNKPGSGNDDMFTGDTNLSSIKLGPNTVLKSDSGISPFFVPKGQSDVVGNVVQLDNGKNNSGQWTLFRNASAYGTWGNSSWLLDKYGNMLVSKGNLSSGSNATNPINDATTSNILLNNNNKFSGLSNVNTITFEDVIAPNNLSALLTKFPNVHNINLRGMNFNNFNGYLSNITFPSDATVELNGNYYNLLNKQINNQINNNSNAANTNSQNISSLTSGLNTGKAAKANEISGTIQNAIDSAVNDLFSNNNKNTEKSTIASVANSVANSTASSYETSASEQSDIKSLTNNKSGFISNVASYYANSYANSLMASSSNGTNTVSSVASSYASSYAKSLSTANAGYETSASESNDIKSLTNNKSGFISSVASNVANSLANSLTSVYETQTNASSKANNSDITSLTSGVNGKSGVISSVASSIANSYASSYANSLMASSSNGTNTVSSVASSYANSAYDHASSYANSQSASASASASSAYSNASSYANTLSNSTSASINNTVTSLNNHIKNSYNSAIASAQNMASNAKNKAEAMASASASSAYSNASAYAKQLSTNASNSIKTSVNSINKSIANASASASKSVASLSGSANKVSASASKGIASNATHISNNSNNINTNSNIASNGISDASSNAQSVANQNSASASVSAANANSNADSYALSLAQNATGVANANAGGIDNTMSYDDQTVQSLSNTVNANTISLANNDNDLYQSKENKPAAKKHGVKIAQLHQPLFYFYALKPLWLHTSAKFTKGNRAEELSAKHGYTLPITRIFKVNGALRFEVKIDGAKYFVTGNRYFARNAYIQPNEVKHNSSVKVLKAIREYKRAGFGKKNFIKGIRKGTVLPIKQAKTVANKQVTRLQLTNGHWITANKNLVKLI